MELPLIYNIQDFGLFSIVNLKDGSSNPLGFANVNPLMGDC